MFLLHVPNQTVLVLVGAVLRAQGAGKSACSAFVSHVINLLAGNDVSETRKVVVSVEINLGGVAKNEFKSDLRKVSFRISSAELGISTRASKFHVWI
eukprot:sb/3479093/